MDTIKILLAATIALLIGAFGWNWLEQREQVKNSPASELARIQKQLAEIKREEQNLIAEKQLRDMGVLNNTPAKPITTLNEEDMAEKAAQMAAIEAKNKALEEELLKKQEADVKRDEDGLIGARNLEKTDKELRRGRQISEALLMARVTEVVNDPATGSFITIELLMPQNVQVDSILSIRRKDGIVGNVKVREIIGNEAIADVLPGVGPFETLSGDELIIAPAF
jgi:hypothetical protein